MSTAMDGGADGTTLARSAWRDLTRRMDELGQRLLEPEFPSDPADRAEGFAHLAQQALCWLGWSVGHGDPRRPFFHRQNDLVTPWGGPNADNVYRHARIDPGLRYRITGRMHGCEQFILAFRVGFMHMAKWGTLKEITASELGIGAGEDFEISLGGTEPGSIEIPEGTTMATFREYYFDWQPREPATVTIQCLDSAAPLPRIDDATVAARLEDAKAHLEASIEYWNDYMVEARKSQTDNAFAPPLRVAKGLAAAQYNFCFFELEPGQALVVDSNVPDAPYWSLQLYNNAWFELPDFVERITSLNHTQTHVDADGRLRVVLADEDPGVPNWLDTGARRTGLLTFRWFWARSGASPTTTVVPFDAVGSTLPPDTPVVDAVSRSQQLLRRRDHLAWRFRT